MNKEYKKYKTDRGAAMLIVVLFFVFISLSILVGIVTPTVREFKIASATFNSRKAYFVAESGSEDSFYRVENNKKIAATESLTIGTDTATTTVTSIGSTQKKITTIGDASHNQRKVSLIMGIGEGAVFKYGTQAGQGGFIFQNNAFVTGSLYSNGPIVGSNGAYITGDAYVAGATGSISNMDIGKNGSGSAHAHTITSSTATGLMYCQTGSGNNKSCNTTQADPTSQDLPISDADITQWETDAASGGIVNGDVTVSSPTTLGPKKIVGNLTVNSILTMANTVYVTGNIIIGTGGTVKLASTYGATSGIILSDGYISIANNSVFQDSGTVGSYILLLSNSACDSSIAVSPCFGNDAISVSNNSNISIVNAQKGTVYFSNNATVKESVGNKIVLKNNVGISYGSGVVNAGFTSGSSGAWNLSSWQETQ